MQIKTSSRATCESAEIWNCRAKLNKNRPTSEVDESFRRIAGMRTHVFELH